MKRLFLILIIISSPIFSFANDYHLFVGPSNNFADPIGIIRLGINDWELGRLKTGVYGFAKMFYFDSKTYYTEFGLGYSGKEGYLFSAIGAEWRFFSFLGLRGELYAVAGTLGYFQGLATVGLAAHF
ncbi:MAG: hypothetical protein IPM57_12515 [Oligoflexia bacterium]|nr:hypothetical protein [Oligoflexia bacterium]